MSFSFVAYDGPEAPLDPNVRRLIRKQAMKDAATERKRRRGYGQHNIGQYPVLSEDSNWTEDLSTRVKSPSQSVTSSSSSSDSVTSKQDRPTTTDTEQSHNQSLAVSCHHTDTCPIPRLHSDLAVAERFSLLLHLTPLTGLRLGIGQFSHAKPALDHSSNSLTTLHLGSRKLLSFIPSRYGHVASLTYATDCVVAKIQQMLHTIGDHPKAYSEATVLQHYTKAIRALQAALDDESQRTTAETLCATELLGIFELLNGSPKSNSWMRHAGGAAQLIQVRGTHRFRTEFEMALFTAHIGPTVMDAFLNNKPCFLAEKRWKQVMHSAICNDESFAEEGDIILGLWDHLVDGPKAFKMVTDLIDSPVSPPQDVIDALIQRILMDRERLLNWADDSQTLPGSLNGELEVSKHGTICASPVIQSGTPSFKHITQLALWGTYVLCRILKARLLVALSPSRFHSLEIECQDLARKIIDLGHTPTRDKNEPLLDNLFVSQSIWIAKGIVQTEKIWCEGSNTGNGMIERWKFEAWCKAIGRTPNWLE